MAFFTFIGFFTIGISLSFGILLLWERIKNKNALKWIRIGDEIEEVGVVLPHKGIVLFIDRDSRDVVMLKSNNDEGYFLKTVKPGGYVPTGKTYSREESKEFIPEISNRLHKEADEDVAIYEKTLTIKE